MELPTAPAMFEPTIITERALLPLCNGCHDKERTVADLRLEDLPAGFDLCICATRITRSKCWHCAVNKMETQKQIAIKELTPNAEDGQTYVMCGCTEFFVHGKEIVRKCVVCNGVAMAPFFSFAGNRVDYEPGTALVAADGGQEDMQQSEAPRSASMDINGQDNAGTQQEFGVSDPANFDGRAGYPYDPSLQQPDAEHFNGSYDDFQLFDSTPTAESEALGDSGYQSQEQEARHGFETQHQQLLTSGKRQDTLQTKLNDSAANGTAAAHNAQAFGAMNPSLQTSSADVDVMMAILDQETAADDPNWQINQAEQNEIAKQYHFDSLPITNTSAGPTPFTSHGSYWTLTQEQLEQLHQQNVAKLIDAARALETEHELNAIERFLLVLEQNPDIKVGSSDLVAVLGVCGFDAEQAIAVAVRLNMTSETEGSNSFNRGIPGGMVQGQCKHALEVLWSLLKPNDVLMQ